MPEDPPPDDAGARGGATGTGRLSRRRLLRAGVNLGAAGALAWGIGADRVGEDDYRSVTYALARPGPGADRLEPRTTEVPAAWYEALQLAFDVQRRVRESGLSAVVGSFVVPGSYDDPRAGLAVEATDGGLVDALEELADGVEIDLTVLDDEPGRSGGDDAADVYRAPDVDGGPVPGGVACRTEELTGTLGPALFDAATGERSFVTSNHLYGAGGALRDRHRGEPLRVLGTADEPRIGRAARGYPLADVVRVAPERPFRPAARLARASPARVLGQYTRVGLADLMAREEPLTKVGAASGRSTGQVEGVDGLTCYTGEACKPGQLKWGGEDTIADGDSGSVSFHADPERPDEGVLVAGVNNARTWWPGGNFTWGTAAHHLLDAYGLHF